MHRARLTEVMLEKRRRWENYPCGYLEEKCSDKEKSQRQGTEAGVSLVYSKNSEKAPRGPWMQWDQAGDENSEVREAAAWKVSYNSPMRWLLPPIPFYRWGMKKLNNPLKGHTKNARSDYQSQELLLQWLENMTPKSLTPTTRKGLSPFHSSLGAHDCFSILRTDTTTPSEDRW